MTDKLIEQIKVDREHNAIGGNDRRRSRVIEYEDRILADAEVIKAATALANLVEAVLSDERLDNFAAQQTALAVFRQAQGRAEKGSE